MSAKNSQLSTALLLLASMMLPICNGSSGLVAVYQCTSDYVEVMDPSAIPSESGMIRICVAGASSAVECQKVLDASIKQASKSIEERMVVGGQQQAAFKDTMEITTKDGTCMVSALLTNKYFIQSGSANALEVVISGSVSIGSATAAAPSTTTTMAPTTTTMMAPTTTTASCHHHHNNGTNHDDDVINHHDGCHNYDDNDTNHHNDGTGHHDGRTNHHYDDCHNNFNSCNDCCCARDEKEKGIGGRHLRGEKLTEEKNILGDLSSLSNVVMITASPETHFRRSKSTVPKVSTALRLACLQ